MTPARRLHAAILALFGLLLVSCQSVGGGAPREGMILYHEPVPPTGLMRKGRLQPMSWVFVTGDREMAQSGAIETRTGVIERAGDAGESPEQDSLRIARMLFERSAKGSTLVLSPERFAELWGRLDEVGLFKLPTQAGSDPPRDEPYFLVEEGGRTRIFARPSIASQRPDDPGIALVRYWQQAKLVFFGFLNEP